MDDPYATIRQLIADYDAKQSPYHNGTRNQPINWATARDREYNYDWLVERWWPKLAHLHLFASGKTGKSMLMLWVAANLAIGRDPFTHEARERERSTYIDKEMSEDLVIQRVLDMGIAFEELEGWLFYYPFPILAPMDTPTGGVELLDLMNQDKSNNLMIDTLSRVVKGEENNNDTYRNFFNYTGSLLKANNISLVRLDHAGHDPKRSRGASSKNDDVDLVYGMERRAFPDGKMGFRLMRTHTRLGNIPEFVDIFQNDEPVSFKSTTMRTWTKQAIDKARELDALNAPLNLTRREAKRLLTDAGKTPGRDVYLAEAIRMRSIVNPLGQWEPSGSIDGMDA